MSDWLTLEELSAYLKLSHPSLYKMAQEGKIPAAKVGRGWRFHRPTIDQWLHHSQETKEKEFPWSDCLEIFLEKLQKEFGPLFSALWIYGSWARGEAREDSDVDLLIVLGEISDFKKDFEKVVSLSYDSTFGKNRPIVFSVTLVELEAFRKSAEPLLLNVRAEGKKAA